MFSSFGCVKVPGEDVGLPTSSEAVQHDVHAQLHRTSHFLRCCCKTVHTENLGTSQDEGDRKALCDTFPEETQKPTPAWVTIHKSWSPRAPCTMCRQLSNSQSLFQAALLIRASSAILTVYMTLGREGVYTSVQFQRHPETYGLFTSGI